MCFIQAESSFWNCNDCDETAKISPLHSLSPTFTHPLELVLDIFHFGRTVFDPCLFGGGSTYPVDSLTRHKVQKSERLRRTLFKDGFSLTLIDLLYVYFNACIYLFHHYKFPIIFMNQNSFIHSSSVSAVINFVGSSYPPSIFCRSL